MKQLIVMDQLWHLVRVMGLLCPMLRGEETKLEVRDVHAIRNLDVMHCAFVVFNVENEGPMSFDGEAALNSLHGLARVENEVFELFGSRCHRD